MARGCAHLCQVVLGTVHCSATEIGHTQPGPDLCVLFFRARCSMVALHPWAMLWWEKGERWVKYARTHNAIVK